jgi:hypothetical protein
MTGKLGEPWFRKKYPSLLGSERRHNFTKENTDNQYVHSQGATTLYISLLCYLSAHCKAFVRNGFTSLLSASLQQQSVVVLY